MQYCLRVLATESFPCATTHTLSTGCMCQAIEYITAVLREARRVDGQRCPFGYCTTGPLSELCRSNEEMNTRAHIDNKRVSRISFLPAKSHSVPSNVKRLIPRDLKTKSLDERAWPECSPSVITRRGCLRDPLSCKTPKPLFLKPHLSFAKTQ